MKFVGVVLASAVLCLASVTRASEDPKQMFQAATAEFNLGHYAKAASMYEEIYKVTLEPVLLYNIAQAHRLGGDFDKAVFFYKGYLRAPAARGQQARGATAHLRARAGHRGQAARPGASTERARQRRAESARRSDFVATDAAALAVERATAGDDSAGDRRGTTVAIAIAGGGDAAAIAG